MVFMKDVNLCQIFPLYALSNKLTGASLKVWVFIKAYGIFVPQALPSNFYDVIRGVDKIS
jgi:hypothetical protein